LQAANYIMVTTLMLPSLVIWYHYFRKPEEKILALILPTSVMKDVGIAALYEEIPDVNPEFREELEMMEMASDDSDIADGSEHERAAGVLAGAVLAHEPVDKSW
jgi:hypothetical protein